ncbi:hypothetical protein DV737_g963, partial [Chaetothyriales sp. CBS 132003]
MTKKKRNHPDLDEVLARPWCYYCERDFDDLKILINHQKAKHFKCERCGRRLNTAGGLSVHMSQVHKENLTAVDNALPNRVGLDIEIFGMEGIPEDIVQQHTQRVLTSYHQAQAERQAATGNPAPGSAAANGQKKPKLESTSDLKKRLAEHKAAKLAAEQGDGSQSERSTPQPVVPRQTSPPNGYAPGSYPSQAAFSPPPHQSPSAFTGQPYQHAGSGQYSNQSSGGPRLGAGAGSVSLPTAPGLPQRPAFGAPPVNAFQFQQMHQGQLPSPPNHVTQPQYRAQNSPSNPAQPQVHESLPVSTSQVPSASSIDDLIATAAHADSSVLSAPKPGAQAAGTPTPASAEKEAADDKTAKKDKEKAKATRLVYSDNETSPEEKMATLPRYAFDHKNRTVVV